MAGVSASLGVSGGGRDVAGTVFEVVTVVSVLLWTVAGDAGHQRIVARMRSATPADEQGGANPRRELVLILLVALPWPGTRAPGDICGERRKTATRCTPRRFAPQRLIHTRPCRGAGDRGGRARVGRSYDRRNARIGTSRNGSPATIDRNRLISAATEPGRQSSKWHESSLSKQYAPA